MKEYKYFNKEKQNQLKYVLLGTSIGYAGGCTNYLLWYDIPIPPYGNIFVSFFGIFLTYAIIRHQLMDIRIVIKRSIVYSISIAVISLLYLISIFILEKTTQAIFGYHSLAISIGTAFAIGLLFMPLRQRIQRFMDRYFFKGSTEEIATQNEQLRQEIIQTEKYKTLTTLATGIAHEVKNPLTAIKTFTEYLPGKLNDKAFLLKFADIVGKEVDRINDMTHQLLDYGKPAPLSIKETHIHKLIDNIVDILNSKFVHHKIDVIKNYLKAPELLIPIDSNQIRQAILNILLNAVEAMPHGGTLTISTSLSETGYFVIKIEDTGAGMSREDLAQAFDPFFSKKDDGTGLGLSITQSLIENHKGIIQVKSKVGAGTVVRIDLPC
jgi:signal transduction histidine kinase